MSKYRCENCKYFGQIIGLTDANGRSHYKPSVGWGMCAKNKPHNVVEKDYACRYFEKRKEQNNG